MKVTIELSDHNARWLRSMASLGRMCDELVRVMGECQCHNIPQTLDQDLDYAIGQVQELKPVLMNIEYCRQQLIDAGVKRLWKSGTEEEER